MRCVGNLVAYYSLIGSRIYGLSIGTETTEISSDLERPNIWPPFRIISDKTAAFGVNCVKFTGGRPFTNEELETIICHVCTK